MQQYQRWEVEEDEEDSIGNEVVFEEEGEDICNRNTSPAGEELYIHTYIHTCTQRGRAVEIHYSFTVLIFTLTVTFV